MTALVKRAILSASVNIESYFLAVFATGSTTDDLELKVNVKPYHFVVFNF